MVGYSCKRETEASNLIEAKGKLTIPTACAGVYSPSSYNNNIVPSFVYGFWNGSGIDIGIFLVGNNVWRPYCSYQGKWLEGTQKEIAPGKTVYTHLWVEKNDKFATAHFTLSEISSNDSELINFKADVEIEDFANKFASGYKISREVVIASNRKDYDESGCYLYNGGYSAHTLVAKNGNSFKWTDATSRNIELVNPWNNGKYECIYIDGTGKNSVLELRRDDGNVNPDRISATRSNPSTGAAESVVITYMPRQ